MTLQANGSISIGQIAAEFGLAASTPFPSGFYGRGGVSGAGALSLSDFYGRSAAPAIVFTPDGGNVANDGPDVAQVALACTADAIWTFAGGGSGGTVNIASGGTTNRIVLTVQARALGNGNTATNTVNWDVTGRSGGVERTFRVSVTAYGRTNGGVDP